ncbi:MAG TPA: patatin-like phospholipase family protein [Anaeromyxobacteraceae bacterium]|nr:patatin-like phospholipase family protein [Anaeromyxobacteraceae bacterium]
MTVPRVALILGGGAARGLAHIGVLEVLEREEIRPAFLGGSSMGGLIAALRASGLDATEILDVARGFRFPRWFVPGGLVPWDRIFAPAVPHLGDATFETLEIPLAVLAVDVESGRPVVLHRGEVLPAVEASCAVPAVLPPVRIEGHLLMDGGLVNALPVDLAALAEPDVVVAVSVRAGKERRLPALDRALSGAGWSLGRLLPNPFTALLSFELLVRAAEISLERQATLAAAMVGPEVLVEPDVRDVGLRDFHRLDDAVDAGRRAAEAALPAIRRAIERAQGSRDPRRAPARVAEVEPAYDPVCAMVVTEASAAASLEVGGRRLLFCSLGCRDAWVRDHRG